MVEIIEQKQNRLIEVAHISLGSAIGLHGSLVRHAPTLSFYAPPYPAICLRNPQKTKLDEWKTPKHHIIRLIDRT